MSYNVTLWLVTAYNFVHWYISPCDKVRYSYYWFCKGIGQGNVDFYSTFIGTHRKGAQVMDHKFYLQTTLYLPLSYKFSPDGATTDCSGRRLIAAYYYLLTLKGWKAELALLADL